MGWAVWEGSGEHEEEAEYNILIGRQIAVYYFNLILSETVWTP